MNKDYLHKYLVMDRQARVITVFSTNTVNEDKEVVPLLTSERPFVNSPDPSKADFKPSLRAVNPSSN